MSLPMKSGPVTIGDELIPWPARVNRGIGLAIDRLCQAAYYAAYRMLKVWWYLRRPHHRGALVALWHEGKILIVRSSYRPSLDLPGGGIRRGEDAREAARREVREEIGLDLPAEALRPAQAGEIFWENRCDHVTIFELTARERPALRLDNREIVAAAFQAPETVVATEISPHLARYLARRRRVPAH